MEQLKYTRLAKNDLFEVIDYIANNNLAAAYKVHDAIMDTCHDLLERPQSTVLVSSAIDGLRRAGVKGFPFYLIFSTI